MGAIAVSSGGHRCAVSADGPRHGVSRVLGATTAGDLEPADRVHRSLLWSTAPFFSTVPRFVNRGRVSQASDASSVISGTLARARLTGQRSFAPCAAARNVDSSIPGTLPTVVSAIVV